MKSKLATAALMLTVLAGTAGYAAAQGRDYDRDGDRYYDRDGSRGGMHAAREFGFRDGATVAREDMGRGKPFNASPRGPYGNADNGYRREFGNKNEYREQYAQAYREGYQNTFRQRGYYR